MKLFGFLTSLGIGVLFLVSELRASEENPYCIHQKAAITSAVGTPWKAVRHLEIVEAAAFQTQNHYRRVYPISEADLQQLYQEEQREVIPFFAYSSMIDKEAGAVKAISPEAAATQTPAIAFGLQRTFNRKMNSETVQGGWGALQRENDLAILNVFEKQDAVLNGVVFQLPLSDLLILAKREVGYDLIPVWIQDWDNARNEQQKPEIFLAYTFQAPDHTGFTSAHVNPIPGYLNYLQKGLEGLGEDFKAMWWATTYLADKKTSVSELPYRYIDLNAKDRQ